MATTISLLSLTPFVRNRGVDIGGCHISYNGLDFNWRWYPSLAWGYLGYPPPTPGVVLNNADAGGGPGLLAGKYGYVCFFYSPSLDHYGAPSPAADVVAGFPFNQVTVTQPPGGYSWRGASRWIIARTLKDMWDSGEYYYLTTQSLASLTYLDNTPDEELGAYMAMDNYPPPVGIAMAGYKQRLFVGKEDRVHVSKVANFEAFPPLEFMNVIGEHGRRVTCLTTFRNKIIVFKDRGIEEMSNLDEVSVGLMSRRDYGVKIGTESPDTVKRIDDTLLFLSPEPLGVYGLEHGNATPQCISRGISDIFTGVASDTESLNKSFALLRRNPLQYWLWVTRQGSAIDNDLCLVCDLRTRGWYFLPDFPAMGGVCIEPTTEEPEQMFLISGGVLVRVLPEGLPYGNWWTDTVTAATGDTVTIAHNYFQINIHTGAHIKIISGTGANQATRIITEVLAPNQVRVTPRWKEDPAALSTVEVMPSHFHVITSADTGDGSMHMRHKRYMEQYLEVVRPSLDTSLQMGATPRIAEYVLNCDGTHISSVGAGFAGPNLAEYAITGYTLMITGGTGILQEREVSHNIGQVLSVSPPWDIVPDTTSEFTLRKVTYRTARGVEAPVLKSVINRKSQRLSLDWKGRSGLVKPQFSSYAIRWLPKEHMGY